MISCTFANAEETQVQFTDNRGDTYTVPADWAGRFREEENDGGGVVGLLARGGLVGPYVPPKVQLPDLQPYQFWAVLELSGYKADLDAYVNGLQGQAKVIARAKLDRATAFRRDNELVNAARAAIGITEEDLDTLWLQAASL